MVESVDGIWYVLCCFPCKYAQWYTTCTATKTASKSTVYSPNETLSSSNYQCAFVAWIYSTLFNYQNSFCHQRPTQRMHRPHFVPNSFILRRTKFDVQWTLSLYASSNLLFASLMLQLVDPGRPKGPYGLNLRRIHPLEWAYVQFRDDPSSTRYSDLHTCIYTFRRVSSIRR